MAGGLLNIITYGAADLFLTGAPQITFFKILYRRYTNFSKESVYVELGNLSFGEEVTIQFPRVGDLISNTYLQLNIPSVHFLKTDTVSEIPGDNNEPTVPPNPTDDPIFLLNRNPMNALNNASNAWMASQDYINYTTIIKPFVIQDTFVYQQAKKLYSPNITPLSYVSLLLAMIYPTFPPIPVIPPVTIQNYRTLLQTDLAIYLTTWIQDNTPTYTVTQEYTDTVGTSICSGFD